MHAATAPTPPASRSTRETAQSLGLGSALAIGTIVPNTGIVANGFVQAGKGIVKENYKEPAIALGPRAGVRLRPDGLAAIRDPRQRLGYFYDRLQGDSIFGQSGNPPVGQQSTVFNSTLQQVAAGAPRAPGAAGEPHLLLRREDRLVAELERRHPDGAALVVSSLDVSYVGAHNFNAVAFGSISTPGGQTPIDLERA